MGRAAGPRVPVGVLKLARRFYVSAFLCRENGFLLLDTSRVQNKRPHTSINWAVDKSHLKNDSSEPELKQFDL